MTSRLQNRRDTAANWTANNPTLAAGELGLETDTAKFKMGNGSTAWNSLAYSYTAGTQGTQGIQGTIGTNGTTTGLLGFNAQTGTTYTLVATDANKLVTASNASAITITVPISVFSANDVINVQQIGAGQVTFAAASGAVITSNGATSAAPKLRVQYSACSIICSVGGATPSFTVIGDIS
jgi:Major tropism determinant N-terminal domain